MSAHNKHKKLGQCFLTDHAIVERIVTEAGVHPGSMVLEVGPGRGILTKGLLHAGAKVHAVELDIELYEHLQKEFKHTENISLEKGNALKFNFHSIPAPYKVVSNLPYSVSVALIKIFIVNMKLISDMTLMVQLEVGERLTAKAGHREFGSLSLYVSYHCNTELLFTVPPEAFRPVPKVDSVVIRLTPRETPAVVVDSEEDFFKFINTAFIHRRKTLRNNIKHLFVSDGFFESCLEHAQIGTNARPEEVSLEKFALLYNEWKKSGETK